jgi:hypothetical protein
LSDDLTKIKIEVSHFPRLQWRTDGGIDDIFVVDTFAKVLGEISESSAAVRDAQLIPADSEDANVISANMQMKRPEEIRQRREQRPEFVWGIANILDSSGFL